MKKLIGIGGFLAVIALNVALNVTNTKGDIGLSFLKNQAIAAGCELKNQSDDCVFKCDTDEGSNCAYVNGIFIFECSDALEVECSN